MGRIRTGVSKGRAHALGLAVPVPVPVAACAVAVAVAFAVVAVVAVAVAAPGAAAIAAPAATAPANTAATATTTAATITREAHVAFENCNAQHMVLSVTVPKRAFPPTDAVIVTVRLRNTGSITCGSPVTANVPQARSSLSVGPCGTLPLIVRTNRGVEVYPGPGVFHCPLESGFRLGPRSTAEAIGSWSQAVYLGSALKPQHAHEGTYRLVVDGAVAVPVTLSRARP